MTYVPLDRDPRWKLSMENATAKMNDCIALAGGCSEYERGLRTLGPVFYHNDAAFREIMIKLDVLVYERSKPWWKG